MSKLDIYSDEELSNQKLPPPIAGFYGSPKIGKSTFSSMFPKPIFLWTERGAAGLKVPKLPKEGPSSSWLELLKCIGDLLECEHDRETVVLDTLDVAVSLCTKHVLATDYNNDTKQYMAFFKGPSQMREEFKRLLRGLELLRDKRGMAVIVISHDGLQKGANALGDDFKKFGGSIDSGCWNLVRDWVDQLGHCCMEYKAIEGKAHQLGKDRWIVFKGSPARDAGCRAGYEMPDKIKLAYSEYEKHMKEGGQ